MQQIQYVSKYVALSEEGLVPRLECPMDQGLLYPNLDKEDLIFLYCLSCEYKKYIGISTYQNIVKVVQKNEQNN
jgi:hypothetical protein